MDPIRQSALLPPYSNWLEDFRSGRNQKKSPLRAVFDRVSLVDGLLVLDGHRLVVPPQARAGILEKLHLAHAGSTKTVENARQVFFWPGLKRDILTMVAACPTCAALAPALPAEPLMLSIAESPMEQVGVDLFHLEGKDFLIMVDRFSGFAFLHLLRSLDTRAVTSKLEEWFYDFGRPLKLRSDGGPQFRTQFGEFCSSLGIEWELTSPYNSQANGLAEAAVKSMKRLVRTTEPSKLRLALQEWRNTPRQDGISPSMAFLGRRTRGELPFLPGQPMVDFPSRPLPLEPVGGRALVPLVVGQRVWLQIQPGTTWKEGVVSEIKGYRSYLVELSSGRRFWRNRRFLRPLTAGERPPGPNVGALEAPALPPPVDDDDDEDGAVPRRSRRAAGLDPEWRPLARPRI